MVFSIKFKYYTVILLSSSALANNATYSVVTLDPTYTSYGVVVDNVTYALNQSPQSPLLYTGEAPSELPYSYCVLDSGNLAIQQEAFTRPALTGNASYNEVYNRTNNIVDIPSLPQIWPSIYNTNVSGNLHVDGQIAVIHIQANENEIEAIHNNVTSDDKVSGNLTFISPTDLKFVSNINVALAGRSSRIWPKQSYTINVKKGGDLYGLTKFKLRASASDPTYMREKMYYDMLRYSAGVAANGASWARVLFNNRPAGFFVFVDQPDKSWLANTYNDGGSDTGILYMGNFGAPSNDTPILLISDLSYLGDNQSIYGVNDTYKIKEKSSDKKDADFTKLAQFTKTIENSQGWDVNKWNDFIDVDIFLKNMAFEFFQGHLDGYLSNANNLLLYDNKGKWTWCSSDLDLTMGNYMANQTNLRTGDYMQYANNSRPLLKALLNVTEFNATYREYITKIEQQLYSLDILDPRIDSFSSLIQQDAEWDATVEKLSKGYSTNDSKVGEIPVDTSNQNFDLPGSGIEVDMQSFIARLFATNITFDVAVNGETGFSTLFGLKQWINNKSINTNQSLNGS
ncbi:coth protein-domain-containing protein [Umbelopsis sp. PMI_123]|nr:coth protein-domain-containing protein [Umbelopsis sp. PMI_123]